jgi:chemotaxis protein CheD
MYSYYDQGLQKEVRIIYIGEYTASGENLYLSTVLGSCVAVALYSPDKRIGGLNHFMLAEGGEREAEQTLLGGAARYGMGAMEFLINDLMKLGVRREELLAKVFGGGRVLRRVGGSDAQIPEKNVEFAFTYLRIEGIRVSASDVGDTIARKIYFDPRTADVYLKRIGGRTVRSIEEQEREYLAALKRKAAQEGEPRFF